MNETLSMVFKGYVVRHVQQVPLGYSIKEIITKAMMELEKCHEICGVVVINPDWYPELRKWPLGSYDREILKTGYVGTLFGADFYMDWNLAPDEMAILTSPVLGDEKTTHIFRIVMTVI